MFSSKSLRHFGVTKPTSVICSFAWRIEYFSNNQNLSLESGKKRFSPEFESSPPGQKWSLEIDSTLRESWYGLTNTEYVCVYLSRSSKKNPQIADVDISVLGRLGISWWYSAKKRIMFGPENERPEIFSFRKVSPIASLLLFPNDTLTLQCNITTNEERSMTYLSEEAYENSMSNN